MDRAKKAVRILTCTAVIDVDVRCYILAVPERLKEAQDLWSLRCTAGTGLADLSSEGGAFDQSAVLYGDGEEARAVDFFPEVEAGLVPILHHIGEVIADDGPEDARRCG